MVIKDFKNNPYSTLTGASDGNCPVMDSKNAPVPNAKCINVPLGFLIVKDRTPKDLFKVGP
jgi:hypothetical protein